jgi:hypothetical protein
MIVRDMLTALQALPRDAELLAFEAGCEDYCEREVDDYLGPKTRPPARTAQVPVGPGPAWWTLWSSAVQHGDPRDPARPAGTAAGLGVRSGGRC